MRDPSGPKKFSLTGTSGKLFPFGGGKTMCPGRVFAKQEVLAAVAYILDKFEIEVVRVEDGTGVESASGFPKIRPAFSGTAVVYPDGKVIAKMFQREPAIQARRDLRRFKQLMETGEIATPAMNRKQFEEMGL